MERLEITSTDIDSSKFTIESFNQMKEQFPLESDETIARFLIARNGIVDKASVLLANHIEWKKTNLPVLKSSCINEIRKGKMYLHGCDLEGHPLLIYRVRMNLPRERDIEEMGRMSLWWLFLSLRHLPPDKTKITLLFDRSDFKSENSDIEFMQHLTPLFQAHFPERLHRVIVYPSESLKLC